MKRCYKNGEYTIAIRMAVISKVITAIQFIYKATVNVHYGCNTERSQLELYTYLAMLKLLDKSDIGGTKPLEEPKLEL